MIVLDIETSGLNYEKCGIWQIGALELEHPENIFFEEARIDDGDVTENSALVVIGKTENELRNSGKQSQKQLLQHFLEWVSYIQIKNCICQNPQFDLVFIRTKAKKFGFSAHDLLVPYKAFDPHSIASVRYFFLHGNFLIDKEKSAMNLTKILEFCGLSDSRISINNSVIEIEGSPHNALEDARLTAECFSRIVYGKKLLSEFKAFEIPPYLKKPLQ